VFVTGFVLFLPSSNKNLNLTTTRSFFLSSPQAQTIIALVISFSSFQARAQAQLPPWSFSLSSPQTQAQVVVASIIFFPLFELEPKLP